MPFIKHIHPDHATGMIGRIYDAARKRAGGVANIIRVMSLDARSTQGSMQFYASLMKSENALSPTRREMIAAVVSNVNACYY